MRSLEVAKKRWSKKPTHYLQGYFFKVLVSERLVSYVVYVLAKQLRKITQANLEIHFAHGTYLQRRLQQSNLFH